MTIDNLSFTDDMRSLLMDPKTREKFILSCVNDYLIDNDSDFLLYCLDFVPIDFTEAND